MDEEMEIRTKIVWEYEVVALTHLSDTQEVLNHLGGDGWELVQVMTHSEYPLGYAILKRRTRVAS